MSEQDARRSSLDVELEWPSARDERKPSPARPAHLAAEPEPAAEGGDTGSAPPAADPLIQLLDELRGDVHGLRVAVLDGPDLTGLRAAVAELRAAVAERSGEPGLAELRAQVAELRALLVDGPIQRLGADLAEVRRLLDEPGTRASELPPVLEELGAMRADLASLRRRISLRAEADRALSSDQRVDDIAAAVVVRLRQAGLLDLPRG